MPIVRVEMLPGRTREQKRELAQVFTQEMARICQVSATAITIVIDEVDKDNWASGGTLMSDKTANAAPGATPSSKK